jgi:hypothetical protein
MSNISLDKLIWTIRGEKVILDSDLARLYGVPVKRLNEQVKRNMDRFPEDFVFRLTRDELDNLKSQIATSSFEVTDEKQTKQHGGRKLRPPPKDKIFTNNAPRYTTQVRREAATDWNAGIPPCYTTHLF